MANFAKYSRGASGHMLKHYERAKDPETGEYVRFGNQDIDPERSHLNYNLGPEREGAQYTFIKERCEQVHCMKRADVNVLGSWVVTAPEGLSEEQLRPFFQASYDALEGKYGRENVVSAYVHMDESGRPHMHFAFVPVVHDQKKDRDKVNAKECVTRAELKQFHPWLEAEVSQRLGYQVQLMNEATKDGNKTVTELKQRRELAKQAEFEAQTKEAEMEVKEAIQNAQNAAYEADAARRRLQDILEELNHLETPEDVQGVKAKPTLVGNSVKLTRKDYELIKSWADRGAAAIVSRDSMQYKTEKLQEEIDRLREQDQRLMDTRLQLAKERESAGQILEQQSVLLQILRLALTVLGRDPDLHRQFRDEVYEISLGRMDWKIQEMVDAACGTTYAAEDKARYFSEHPEKALRSRGR